MSKEKNQFTTEPETEILQKGYPSRSKILVSNRNSEAVKKRVEPPPKNRHR